VTTSNGRKAIAPRPAHRPAAPRIVDMTPTMPAPEPEVKHDIASLAKDFAAYPSNVRAAAIALAAWGNNAQAITAAATILDGLSDSQRRRVADIAALLTDE